MPHALRLLRLGAQSVVMQFRLVRGKYEREHARLEASAVMCCLPAWMLLVCVVRTVES